VGYPQIVMYSPPVFFGSPLKVVYFLSRRGRDNKLYSIIQFLF